MISALVSGGLTDELLLELGVAHDLGVVLQRAGDLLFGRGEHGASLGHVGEREGERRQHDRPSERQPERQAERARRGIHPGRFTDAFVRDRRQRVVVQLRHQQIPSPEPAISAGAHVPAGIRPRHDEDQHQQPSGQQQEADPDDGGRTTSCRPASRPPTRPRTCSARAGRCTGQTSWRCIPAPSAGRSATRSSSRRARSAAASARRSRAGNPERNRSGSISAALSVALAAHQPVAEPGHGQRTDSKQAPTDSPPSCQTRMPSTMPPMPITESIAPTMSTSALTGVGHVVDELDTGQDDDDDDDFERKADSPRQIRRYEATDERSDRGRDCGRSADKGVDRVCAAPGKLPCIRDCMAGRRSDAPRPPTIAQKKMMVVISCAKIIAPAPTA